MYLENLSACLISDVSHLFFFPAIQFSINLSQFSKWENEDQIAHNLITHFLLNICPYYWKLILIQHYRF